jgi:nitrogen fixation NifU-like protein
MLDYSEKVMEEFRNPKNMGMIEDADGIGKVGNPTCGDMMWIYIKVNNGILTDVKFKTFGCVAAIATSSKVTQMVLNKPIEEALKITNKAVAEALDGLPSIKMHCSLLAEEGIKAAIEDYMKNQS